MVSVDIIPARPVLVQFRLSSCSLSLYDLISATQYKRKRSSYELLNFHLFTCLREPSPTLKLQFSIAVMRLLPTFIGDKVPFQCSTITIPGTPDALHTKYGLINVSTCIIIHNITYPSPTNMWKLREIKQRAADVGS